MMCMHVAHIITPTLIVIRIFTKIYVAVQFSFKIPTSEYRKDKSTVTNNILIFVKYYFIVICRYYNSVYIYNFILIHFNFKRENCNLCCMPRIIVGAILSILLSIIEKFDYLKYLI